MLCYINVTLWVHQYIITCLCPNLVSFPFYAIPIFPFKFPEFFIYLSPAISFLDLGTYISLFGSLLCYKANALYIS